MNDHGTYTDSMFNDDDDFGTRIEPGRHKENLKVDDDDIDIDVTVNEKKDDNVEKTGDAAEEKDNVDHIDHTLVKTHAIGSMETRNKPMQKPIPTPSRSPRKDLSSYKTISKELTGTVSPTTATTSNPKTNKSGFTSNKKRILPGSIDGICRRREVLDHCNNVVPELTFAKTNEMIKEEMPRLVHLVVIKDPDIIPTNVLELISKEFPTHAPKMIEELFQKHMQNTTPNLYPTPSSSTAEVSNDDLQH
ncbi:hypothetical protein Tco_1539581 [Tanacetum coccineum]